MSRRNYLSAIVGVGAMSLALPAMTVAAPTLSLASASVSTHEEWLAVKNVELTLDLQAASALSGVFHATVPAGITIGAARVSVLLGEGDR